MRLWASHGARDRRTGLHATSCGCCGPTQRGAKALDVEITSVFSVDGSFGNAVYVAQRTWDYSMSKGRRELILKLVIRQGPLGELMGSTTLF